MNDSGKTLQGNPVILNVLRNDENYIGASICYVESPTDNGGTAVISEGMIVYTPAAGFCGVDNFKYKLCKPGCEPSENAMVTVDITCNTPLSCISGYKIDNRDGSGIPGWTISLYNDTGAPLRNVSTDSMGRYKFFDLSPGNYIVREKMKPGWTNVTPTSIDVEVGFADVVNQNFTNTPLTCISGYKIDNRDGSGIPGWTISLYNDTGARIRDVSTDGKGRYKFFDLSPGNYIVREKMKPGWTNIGPKSTDVRLGFVDEINKNFTNVDVSEANECGPITCGLWSPPNWGFECVGYYG